MIHDPIILTEGNGTDCKLPGIAENIDADQKMFMCDSETVHMYSHGTDDDGFDFTPNWISTNIGADDPGMDLLIKRLGAKHYTEGSNGILRLINEDGETLITLTLAAAVSGNHPETVYERGFNDRTPSVEIDWRPNFNGTPTRADLDAVLVEAVPRRRIE